MGNTGADTSNNFVSEPINVDTIIVFAHMDKYIVCKIFAGQIQMLWMSEEGYRIFLRRVMNNIVKLEQLEKKETNIKVMIMMGEC